MKKIKNIKPVIFATIILLLSSKPVFSQTELRFDNLDSLLAYAENNSIAVKNAGQQTLIAKWQKISAQTGLINFRVQTNFSMTDNLELPVTYLPGEAFGGAPGTFKEVTTGQQYITNLNIIPQIDLINPVSWAKLKSAKTGSELTEVNNLLARKTLFESVSAAYYNVISLKEQVNITEKTLLTADSLLTNVQNKYDQGIVRLQDLNDTKVNKLTTQDKLNQLKKSLEQQYYALKILCDIPENENLVISEKPDYKKEYTEDLQTDNQLKYKAALLEAEKANAEVKQYRRMQLPVVSLMFYDAWQQNSNNSFFDDNANWINPKYIGLKISMPFPSISAYTQTKTAEINKTISLQNAEHTKLQNELENKQLKLDYEKAYSQLKTAEQIKELKEQNYTLALNQFNADILSSDRLLTAFNDMLISRLNYSNALAAFLHAESVIDINNKIK
ncbi:MAG: TolC family protein [Chlorobi bacterium]|nr:TolC family protein [Chlorobiota bacterium]